MRKLQTAFVLMGSAFIALGAGYGGARVASTTESAATFWRCGNGLDFQTNGSTMVRCHKNASTDPNPLLACTNVTVAGVSVGTFARTDFSGNRDMCVGQPSAPPGMPTPAPVSFNRVCTPTDLANGYSLVIRAGNDTCDKTTAEVNESPYIQVTH